MLRAIFLSENCNATSAPASFLRRVRTGGGDHGMESTVVQYGSRRTGTAGPGRQRRRLSLRETSSGKIAEAVRTDRLICQRRAEVDHRKMAPHHEVTRHATGGRPITPSHRRRLGRERFPGIRIVSETRSGINCHRSRKKTDHHAIFSASVPMICAARHRDRR